MGLSHGKTIMTVQPMRLMCCSNSVIHSSEVNSSCWLWQKMSIHKRASGWSANLTSRANRNSRKLYFQAWLINTLAVPTSLEEEEEEELAVGEAGPATTIARVALGETLHQSEHVCSGAVTLHLAALHLSLVEGADGCHRDTLGHWYGHTHWYSRAVSSYSDGLSRRRVVLYCLLKLES